MMFSGFWSEEEGHSPYEMGMLSGLIFHWLCWVRFCLFCAQMQCEKNVNHNKTLTIQKRRVVLELLAVHIQEIHNA